MAHCRAGYEPECASELEEMVGSPDPASRPACRAGVGFVDCDFGGRFALPDASRRIRLSELVFSRQLLFRCARIEDLPPGDRLDPIVSAIAGLGSRFSDVVLETADTDDARRLGAFIRAFSPRVREAMASHRLLAAGAARLPRLHLFFTDSSRVSLCASQLDNASPWPMGIPRIRALRAAPSRSALKLAEALMVLTGDAGTSMRPGSRAVDLGAAPGGWSWQLAQRGLRVAAVDNGRIAAQVLDTGLVEHIRADGFTFRPERAVEWLTCDIADRPGKVAALIASWFEAGLCSRCIFNLKLPMKKRLPETRRCLDALSQRLRRAGLGHVIRAKHLYHDRDEITVFVARNGKSPQAARRHRR